MYHSEYHDTLRLDLVNQAIAENDAFADILIADLRYNPAEAGMCGYRLSRIDDAGDDGTGIPPRIPPDVRRYGFNVFESLG
jgi:hypothetical protein